MDAYAADHAIVQLSTEGRITSWHVGAERLVGHAAAQAIGMRFAQLFSSDPTPQMDTAARTGECAGEQRGLRRDGSGFDAAVLVTALHSSAGQLQGFLALTEDMTQRRHVPASQLKGEFLATISHELRTPLSAILGWAHVLERGVSDPATVQHGLAAISRNARLQVELIEDLLDMNRIEGGQLRLSLQRIELGGVVAAAIDANLPAASAKGVGLRTVFGPDSGLVMGDAARLQQAVGKLLGNAIKFTPSGGQVSVSLSQAGGFAEIAVADTGQGIAPDFLDLLFDRFQQQDASSTRPHGGLGIGLAIVWHLVQLHGGVVRAHSPGPGLGATFTVVLPCVESAATGLAVAATDAAPPLRLDGVSVLLVDDEPDVRAITSQLLQDAGAHVLAAANADEALELLQRDRPAVILSDIGMPHVDGHELLRRVRALSDAAGGRTPAAAVTAYTLPEDRARSMAAGYQLHLAKPVAPVTLLKAVAALAGLPAH